jgi:hypothetical protein
VFNDAAQALAAVARSYLQWLRVSHAAGAKRVANGGYSNAYAIDPQRVSGNERVAVI